MDEPPELGAMLERYCSRLLGAILADPRRAFGPRVSRLTSRDITSSPLLQRVLGQLREQPASSPKSLVLGARIGMTSLEIADEMVNALEQGFPYLAEFYAFQILRLQRRRRKFWRAMRRAYRAQLATMEEWPGDSARPRLKQEPPGPPP